MREGRAAWAARFAPFIKLFNNNSYLELLCR
jgi:hypothetical protein